MKIQRDIAGLIGRDLTAICAVQDAARYIRHLIRQRSALANLPTDGILLLHPKQETCAQRNQVG